MNQEINTEADNYQNDGSNLWKEWRDFLKILLSPSILVLILVTIFLIYSLLNIPPGGNIPPLLEATLTVIISISSGVVGALISERWSKITESSILITRGKSAIRGLKLLLNNIATMEKRVYRFLPPIPESNENDKIILYSYEEIVERCNLLQEQAISAIEEWQDIIPEAANLKTKIGVISTLKVEQIRLKKEIEATKEELTTTKEQSQDQKTRLENLLGEKTDELAKVERQLKQERRKFDSSLLGGTGVISAITQTPSIYVGPEYKIDLEPTGGRLLLLGEKECPHCGNTYYSKDNIVCPSCGK